MELNKRKLIIFFVIFLFLYSFNCCQNSDKINLRPIKNIEICPRDSTEWGVFHSNIYYDVANDSEHLVWYNGLLNSFDFYNLGTGNFEQSIELKENNKIDGFYIHNKDSIFAINKRENKIALYSSEGDKINEYDYDSLLSKPVKFESYSSHNAPLIFKSNKLYINIGAMLKVRGYLKQPKLLITDIGEKGIGSAIKTIYFPEKYQKGKDYNFYYPGYTLAPSEEILASFEVSHYVYKYNGTKRVGKYLIKSAYLDSFNVFNPKKMRDRKYNVKFQIKSGRYGGIFYDKYRNLYYRLVLHPQELIDDENRPNRSWHRSWSIIVCDSNLEVIDEIYMKKKKYYPYIYITSEGLLIKRYVRPENCGDNGCLCYTLYKLEIDD